MDIFADRSLDDSDDEHGQLSFIQTGSKTYTLQIDQVRLKDSGYYWCKVWQNNVIKSQRNVLLFVNSTSKNISFNQ